MNQQPIDPHPLLVLTRPRPHPQHAPPFSRRPDSAVDDRLNGYGNKVVREADVVDKKGVKKVCEDGIYSVSACPGSCCLTEEEARAPVPGSLFSE